MREKLGTAGDSKSTALPMGTCTRAKALQVLLNPSVFFQCLTRRAPQGVAGHLLFVDDRKGRMGPPNHRRRAARSSALGGWEGWLQGEQDLGAESGALCGTAGGNKKSLGTHFCFSPRDGIWSA